MYKIDSPFDNRVWQACMPGRTFGIHPDPRQSSGPFVFTGIEPPKGSWKVIAHGRDFVQLGMVTGKDAHDEVLYDMVEIPTDSVQVLYQPRTTIPPEHDPPVLSAETYRHGH